MPSNKRINYYKSKVLSSVKNYQLNPLQNKHKDGLYLLKNQAWRILALILRKLWDVCNHLDFN